MGHLSLLTSNIARKVPRTYWYLLSTTWLGQAGVAVCGTIGDTAEIQLRWPCRVVGKEARHGTHGLFRLLGAAAAQGARPDPGRAGAPGRLRRGDDQEDRGRRAAALAPDRRASGGQPAARAGGARGVC